MNITTYKNAKEIFNHLLIKPSFSFRFLCRVFINNIFRYYFCLRCNWSYSTVIHSGPSLSIYQFISKPTNGLFWCTNNMAKFSICYTPNIIPKPTQINLNCDAAAIFAVPHVAGGLVGGASLDAVAFDAICSAASSAALR